MLIDKGASVLAAIPRRRSRWRRRAARSPREIAKLATDGARTRRRASRDSRASTKRVAWAEPLPLDDVKTVGRALGASVNDVLLSCVAGALRDYLVEHGDAVDALTVRALVPVNLRPMEKAYKLGNQFGLVFLDLPIGIENPIERLYAVRANMRALKGSLSAAARARVARGDGRRARRCCRTRC